MAFDVRLVVLNSPYNDALVSDIVKSTNQILYRYDIAIESLVSEKEYMTNMSSKEINKYLRIKKDKLDSQLEEKYKLVKYASESYKMFDVFANSKYASISISAMGKYTVIWHNFSSKIQAIKQHFDDMQFLFAEYISEYRKLEAMVFRASSISRQDDLFAMYFNGKMKFTASRKNALTDTKQNFGIDINEIMDNVDTNLAIHYSIEDYAFLRKCITDLNDKIQAINAMAEEKGEMVGPDGTKLTSAFISEHQALLAKYTMDLEYAAKLLKMDPIGTIKFIKMKKANIEANIIEGGVTPEL